MKRTGRVLIEDDELTLRVVDSDSTCRISADLKRHIQRCLAVYWTRSNSGTGDPRRVTQSRYGIVECCTPHRADALTDAPCGQPANNPWAAEDSGAGQ